MYNKSSYPVCTIWSVYTIEDKLTPWSKVLFEKLNSCSASEDIAVFCGNHRFITYSQEPTTGPYPEPDESSPHPHTLFL